MPSTERSPDRRRSGRGLTSAAEDPQAEALASLAARVLERARGGGAQAAEVSVIESRGLSVTVRMGEVETIEHNRDRRLSVTVYRDQRKGSASSSDLAPAAVDEAVDSAGRIAAYSGRDPCAGLAPAELMATDLPDLDLYHPWPLAPERAAALALEAEDAARGLDPRITNSEGATLSSREALRVYANSHGFVGSYRGSQHSLGAVVIAADAGKMQRDHWYSAARCPAELEAPASVGRRAGERALRRLGARQVPTRRAPVLYAAEVARSLLGHFVAAVSGTSLYRRSSFLLDQLGQPVFPPGTRIHEQPRLPRGPGSAPFDADGVATRDRDLVADGVLESYALGAYSACRLGRQSTGNAGGVRNLTLEPSAPGLDVPALLGALGEGLYVTELIGMGVNPVTGDYSRGAAGFWVEGGEIAFPVEEVTVAGNLRQMYRGVSAVGRDVDRRGNLRTGSILIDGLTLAGS